MTRRPGAPPPSSTPSSSAMSVQASRPCSTASSAIPCCRRGRTGRLGRRSWWTCRGNQASAPSLSCCRSIASRSRCSQVLCGILCRIGSTRVFLGGAA